MKLHGTRLYYLKGLDVCPEMWSVATATGVPRRNQRNFRLFSRRERCIRLVVTEIHPLISIQHLYTGC